VTSQRQYTNEDLAIALDTDDVYGAREDRREDLECITGRDVTGGELDAWIVDGTLPGDRDAASLIGDASPKSSAIGCALMIVWGAFWSVVTVLAALVTA
jgi:hypothetical protein